MATHSTDPQPSRPTEIARLELARLAPELPLKRVFARACELAASAISVERVGVWLFVDDRSALRCVALYERSKGEHSSGAVLRIADFPTYFASLNIRKAVPAEVAATDSRTAELADSYLRPLGITSLLDAGIFIDGEMVGVVCHEHVGNPREWTTENRDFAGSMADLLALRIKSAEVRELREAHRSHEERLKTLEKGEVVGQVAAGVAHDFSNLLTAIAGFAEMLLLRNDLQEQARGDIQEILGASERGMSLVKEILEFSKVNANSPSVINLSDVCAEFLPVLRAAVGAKCPVRFSRPEAVGKVLMDKNQFTRILLNLVINARDAMPDGGPIQISVLPVHLSEDQNPSGNYIMLEVVDTGIGMDEATLRRASDPFFTTKKQGTGLGLAIIRRIADRAGGFLRIESNVNQGTAIRVFFPRVGASSGATIEFEIPLITNR